MTDPRSLQLKAEGFKEPNYTQTPNDLFILMPEMGDAELRVVLAICRKTFGYHRTKVRLSLSKLQAMTGLSKQGVLNGTHDAIKRGLIIKNKGNGVNQWVVNVVDKAIVNRVDRSSQRGGHPSIKERLNKHIYKDINTTECECGAISCNCENIMPEIVVDF